MAFEHAGPISTNPILADSGLFRKFCNHWSVTRTIRKGTHDQFRCELRDSVQFSDALNDPTGKLLDQLHEGRLRPRYGTIGKKGSPNAIPSVLSKIATFMRPDVFTAWDSYAIPGLNPIVGRPQTLWFATYADYLSSFNSVWNGPYGQRIRELKNPSTLSVTGEPRFQRRILDLYLMAEGGYDHRKYLNEKPLASPTCHGGR